MIERQVNVPAEATDTTFRIRMAVRLRPSTEQVRPFIDVDDEGPMKRLTVRLTAEEWGWVERLWSDLARMGIPGLSLSQVVRALMKWADKQAAE